MIGVRHTITVIITFRKSNKNSLEHRADACRSSKKKGTPYIRALFYAVE